MAGDQERRLASWGATLPRLQGPGAVLAVDFDRVAGTLPPALRSLIGTARDGVALTPRTGGLGLGQALGLDVGGPDPKAARLFWQTIDGRRVLNLRSAPRASHQVADVPLPVIAPLAGTDWTFALAGEVTFRRLIADGFNALSDHLKLEAVPPGEGGPGEAAMDWFLRGQNRILFQGTIQWGDAPPVSRQHEQLGFELHGDADGRLAVRQTHSRGATLQIDVHLCQSFGLESVAAAGGAELRLKGSELRVSGAGIAEETLMGIVRELFDGPFKQALEAVPLSAATALLAQSLRLIDKTPRVTGGGLFGQMVLVGEFG
ncbi:hypothetical protein Rru_A0196 [Rhodospirillum rubrum ATCC 11170]|uniref:Uncharacterized protein n=1 Tax=Rhodospirillum rubrum (strain ATCC 11170 / ATH 1.1.1 / DSM 467 / LMG 4362 / NCIMB 8255 / S1) TaxID=269796 RepID=Q2RXZ4_RHORT|nr:hypothetical protein Rru_A0196 [Rhodospirillum rubrum ATCC 11170]MBK5952546.1 hypothetical protein [Rhodospirillum rubrum]HAP99313.1 hypothetical protein [Rhodospirillum rubrum]